MDKLWHEFEKLQEEFHKVIEQCPLLEDDINEIFEKNIKEIEELILKNDEYYLKKAISKLEDLIEMIKEKSEDTQKIFTEYDKLTSIWNHLEIKREIDNQKLNKINHQVKKANDLINRKSYTDIKEAYQLFNETIKELKEYTK